MKSNIDIHASYLIVIIFLVVIIGMHMHDRKDLKATAIEQCEEIELLEKQVDDLQTENNIFTSMLGEIENEPGGHTILKKLWDKHQNTDE